MGVLLIWEDCPLEDSDILCIAHLHLGDGMLCDLCLHIQALLARKLNLSFEDFNSLRSLLIVQDNGVMKTKMFFVCAYPISSFKINRILLHWQLIKVTFELNNLRIVEVMSFVPCLANSQVSSANSSCICSFQVQ